MKPSFSLLFACVLCSANVAGAETSATKEDLCRADGFVARVIAMERQFGGAAMSEVMQKFSRVPSFRRMIIEAFEMPRMLTKQNRTFVVDEFANNWSLRCYKDGSVVPLDLALSLIPDIPPGAPEALPPRN